MRCIILTAGQAADVRGKAGHVALDPVLLADGQTYVLPERVLRDPAHAPKGSILQQLPVREVDAAEFVQPDAPGEDDPPAEVVYSFTPAEVDELRAAVQKADSVSVGLSIKLAK